MDGLEAGIYPEAVPQRASVPPRGVVLSDESVDETVCGEAVGPHGAVPQMSFQGKPQTLRDTPGPLVTGVGPDLHAMGPDQVEGQPNHELRGFGHVSAVL